MIDNNSKKTLKELNQAVEKNKNKISGILWFISACFFSALITITAKFLSSNYNVYQIYLLHACFGIILYIPIIFKTKGKILVSNYLHIHIIRALITIVCGLVWFYALQHSPIFEAVSLKFATPIFITLLAILILKEKPNLMTLFALITCFIGIVLIIQPQFNEFKHAYFLVLLSAFLAAVYHIITKKLVLKKEEPDKIVILFLLIVTIIFTPFAPLYFKSMNLIDICVAILLSFSLVGYVRCFSIAYSKTDISLLQPFDLTRLVFALIFAYFLFGEIVSMWTLIGVIVIVFGVQLIYYYQSDSINKKPKKIIKANLKKTETKQELQKLNQHIEQNKDKMSGVLLFIIACFFSACNTIITKHLVVRYNIFQIEFLHVFLAVLIYIPLMLKTKFVILRTSQLNLHYIRGFIHVICSLLWIYALKYSPIAEAVSLKFATPIFITLLAILTLKEKPSSITLFSLIIGFIGILLVVQPQFTEFKYAYFLVLLAAFLSAIYHVIAKHLTVKDSPDTITLYFFITMSIISLPLFILFLEPMKIIDVFITFLLASVSVLYIRFMVTAYSRTDISLLQPFDFTRLVFASILAFIIFGTTTGPWTITGAIVILSSAGLLTLAKKYELSLTTSQKAEHEQRERAEKAEQKAKTLLKTRMKFFNMVVHDLKNPIGGVQTCMEMIESENTNQGKGELIKEVNPLINQSLADMNELVYKIMDASKIESGKEIEIHKTDFNIQKLYQEIINAFKLKAEHKNIELKIQIDKSIKNNTINSDPNLIKRIITNLVSNALKFTKKGSVTLTARFDKLSDRSNKNILILSVKDTGQGIAKQDIPKILEEYGQTIESSKESTGTGLGLNIVKKFTEALKGKLEIESKIGKGSEFKIVF